MGLSLKTYWNMLARTSCQCPTLLCALQTCVLLSLIESWRAETLPIMQYGRQCKVFERQRLFGRQAVNYQQLFCLLSGCKHRQLHAFKSRTFVSKSWEFWLFGQETFLRSCVPQLDWHWSSWWPTTYRALEFRKCFACFLSLYQHQTEPRTTFHAQQILWKTRRQQP